MISALARRSTREITRRRGGSILTILTITVAIAGVWLLAIPNNVEASLQERVSADAMHTARLAPTAADLDDEQLATLRAVGNVGALDARTLARTEMRVDGRLRFRPHHCGRRGPPLVRPRGWRHHCLEP